MRRAFPGLALLAIAAVATGGCGQAAARDTIRATSTRFLAAYSAQDGAAACAALSQDTRKELVSQEQRPCPEAIGQIQLKPGAVRHVDVQLTNAKVDLASGESMFLSDESDGWRISAVGCKPQGDPTNTPMDCELQA
jgi:hypothetical protein